MEALGNNKLHELTAKIEEYYCQITRDHHKDMDCHFGISAYWSYGSFVGYRIMHNGYINQVDTNLTYATYKDAIDALVQYLEDFIEE